MTAYRHLDGHLPEVNSRRTLRNRQPLAAIGFFSNPWVLGAWALTVCMQVAAIYVPFLQKALHTVPLSLEDWGLVLLIALPIFLIPEAVKWLHWRFGSTDSKG